MDVTTFYIFLPCMNPVVSSENRYALEIIRIRTRELAHEKQRQRMIAEGRNEDGRGAVHFSLYILRVIACSRLRSDARLREMPILFLHSCLRGIRETSLFLEGKLTLC